ncbi:MAG: ABC transporter substrate-binding protein [Candidatus Tectomicrobia bacterium]|uniref:ABC transporter substrate-binding protein n=1 Tax=Tectimicrobiota bacterium TaxID=2528274 RepID=A0A932GQ48_UNCTE|nr:ABC transporter substrate-binding protein [Candidatus Tectomicrobia bacterium]
MAAQMFAGGTGDIVVIGFQGVIRLAETQTVDVTIIGQTIHASVWTLVAKAGSPIRNLYDLKGKRIGITAFGSLSDCQIRYELQKIGLDPKKDVQLLALGDGPSQLAALQLGHADAVLQSSPILGGLLKRGEVQVALDMKNEKFVANVFIARSKAIQANPSAYANFMRAYKEALHRIATDPGYATEIATYVWGTRFSAEDIQAQLKDYIDNYWSLDGVMTQKEWELGKQILIKCGASREDSFPSYDKLTEHAPK